MNTNEPVTELPGRRWVEVAVVVGCLLLLAGVLLPAVHNARQAARRTQSKNNLKQPGLAIYNYHDVNSVLPPGGDVLADGTAKHGWYTRLVPYLAASTFTQRSISNVPGTQRSSRAAIDQGPAEKQLSSSECGARFQRARHDGIVPHLFLSQS